MNNDQINPMMPATGIQPGSNAGFAAYISTEFPRGHLLMVSEPISGADSCQISEPYYAEKSCIMFNLLSAPSTHGVHPRWGAGRRT